MPVTPAADGKLVIDQPTPDLRYDMGNTRLFAALDGRADILLFRLPEGISVLKHWQGRARLDGVLVHWTQAGALGRSWTMHGTALDGQIMLRSACDSANPALAQVWTVTNAGKSQRVFTLKLAITFDLMLPAVRVGPSSTTARVYTFLRDHPVARRALGSRRWSVLNPIGEAQKRIGSRPRRSPIEIEPVGCDSFRVRGDITALLRGGDVPDRWSMDGDRLYIEYRAVIKPGQTVTLPVLLAAGDSAETLDVNAMLDDADGYAAWLSSAFEHDDPVLRSMFAAGLNAALSMYKELPSGFKGLWAGPGYAYPPRIYFRDSYWTALNVLPYKPGWVRDHLLLLATGVHVDGVCPSGVIDISILPLLDQEEDGAGDWLPDHQDSPAYFVLLLFAYLAWTGDTGLLRETVPDGRSLWTCAQVCLNRLVASPAKERAPNDWADNVLRSEWVTYDLALLCGALEAASAIGRFIGDTNAAGTYAQDARHISDLLQIHAWDEARGFYIDYRRTGDLEGEPFVEDHLALDTLMAVRFGAAPPERADRVLDAVRSRLQTRHNPHQPYGDWGVMCCWPPYRKGADLFAKSAQAYNYHNGAEWPYLSAIYAAILLERGDPGWRYPLTRWWEIQLERGWLTPVEYHSPAHGHGALLQGWSGMVVNAMLSGGAGLCPALDGMVSLRVPPWGASIFRHVMLHGREHTVTVNGGVKLHTEA